MTLMSGPPVRALRRLRHLRDRRIRRIVDEHRERDALPSGENVSCARRMRERGQARAVAAVHPARMRISPVLCPALVLVRHGIDQARAIREKRGEVAISSGGVNARRPLPSVPTIQMLWRSSSFMMS